jgi:Leucine-rich repeat (LRR) protein
MIKTLLTVFLFFSLTTFAQDYSSIGKKIIFSDSLKSAAKYKDIDKALEHPEQVICLMLTNDGNGEIVTKFSANATKFKNLRKLVLMNQGGPMTKLSDSIWTLKKIEYLELINFPGYSTAGIKNLKQLKYLSLDGLALKEFPAETLELTNLEFLGLSCNFLSALPAGIGQLKNLKEIELTNNCFTKIPAELSQLGMLVYITINNAEHGATLADGSAVCDNTITEFPTVLKNISTLKEVHCFFKVTVTPELKKEIRSTYKGIKFT